MDMKNHFHTKTTYMLMRFDYLVLLLLSVYLFIVHLDEIRWPVFVATFVWQDLIGYLPAFVVYYFVKKGKVRYMPKIFYVLYNVTHSIATNVCLLVVWAIVIGGWEWAMLSLPIHLFFDRSIPGNVYKPFKLAFEPVLHDDYKDFLENIAEKSHWGTQTRNG